MHVEAPCEISGETRTCQQRIDWTQVGVTCLGKRLHTGECLRLQVQRLQSRLQQGSGAAREGLLAALYDRSKVDSHRDAMRCVFCANRWSATCAVRVLSRLVLAEDDDRSA